MGTKANPGPFDCHADADTHEPIFTLRARDPLASMLVDLWVDLRELSRPRDHEPDRYREQRKRDDATNCAIAMRQWRALTYDLIGQEKEGT